MIGLDTNVLVSLAATDHPDRQRALAAFARELSKSEEIVLSPAVAAEFLHVITDPRRYISAQSMPEAVAWLRSWNIKVAPRWIIPNESAIKLWLQWMEQFHLGRKRILDTQYAAMLHVHGVRRLLTNNADDFRVFGVFEIVGF